MAPHRLRRSLPALAALLCAMLAATDPAAAQAPASRAYTLGSIDAIEIAGSAHVRYVQGAAGTADQVQVAGDDDVQKSVALELRDGVLTIRPAGAWKFWNSQRVQVEVVSRALRRVGISGAADLVASGLVQVPRLAVGISGAGTARFDQLRAEQLRFNVSGAGDGQIAGTVGELQVQVSGRGNFRGEQLASQRAQVTISGIGDVKVWVEQDLQVAVSGIGTVDYWGTPTVKRHTSGIGRINERGPRPGGAAPVTPPVPAGSVAAPAGAAAPAAPTPPVAPAAPTPPQGPPAPPAPQ